MATTTNFGWETPDDTDLVKDGAAAMRTLGNSIDTSFVDLKGGTSGQILSKASNTDLDYTWIDNQVGDITAVTAGSGLTGGGTSGAVSLALDSAAVIAPTIVDAKGDLIAATAADTVSRLAIGTNGQVLTADSTAATGIKWATPASSGGMTLLASGTLSGASLDLTSIDQTYTDLALEITDANWGTADDYFIFRMNNESGNLSSSLYQGAAPLGTSTFQNFGDASRFLLYSGSNALRTGKNSIYLTFPTYATSKNRPYVFGSMNYQQTSGNTMGFFVGYLNSALAINRITFATNAGYSFTSGSYKLWGVK